MRFSSVRKESLSAVFLCGILFGAAPPCASRAAAVSGVFGPAASMRVYVVDQVKDGCWTNAPDIKGLAEKFLRRAGIRVVESPLDLFSDYPDFRKIVIRARGYRTTSGVCIGSLTIHSGIEVGWSPQGASAHSQSEFIAEEQIGNFLLSDSGTLNGLIVESVHKSLAEFLANAAKTRNEAGTHSVTGRHSFGAGQMERARSS